jgi:hypothetical protein
MISLDEEVYILGHSLLFIYFPVWYYVHFLLDPTVFYLDSGRSLRGNDSFAGAPGPSKAWANWDGSLSEIVWNDIHV